MSRETEKKKKKDDEEDDEEDLEVDTRYTFSSSGVPFSSNYANIEDREADIPLAMEDSSHPRSFFPEQKEPPKNNPKLVATYLDEDAEEPYSVEADEKGVTVVKGKPLTKQQVAYTSKGRRQWYFSQIVPPDDYDGRKRVTAEPIRLIYDDVSDRVRHVGRTKARREWFDLYKYNNRVRVLDDHRKPHEPGVNTSFLREVRLSLASEYFEYPTVERSIFVFFAYFNIRDFLMDSELEINTEAFHDFVRMVNDSVPSNEGDEFDMERDRNGLRAQLVVQAMVYSYDQTETDAFLKRHAQINMMRRDNGDPARTVYEEIYAQLMPSALSAFYVASTNDDGSDPQGRFPNEPFYMCVPDTCIRPQFLDCRLFGDLAAYSPFPNVPFFDIINGKDYPAVETYKADDAVATCLAMILQHGIMEANQPSRNAFAEFLANDPRLITGYVAEFLGIKTRYRFRYS